MRINIKKGLLLSALAIQTFCSQGSWATGNVALDRGDQVSTQRTKQLACDSTHYLGDTSSTALALVIGKPVDGLSSIHKKLDMLSNLTNGLHSQVQVLVPTDPYTPPAGDPLTGVLLALRLTNIVDNMMNSAFNQTIIESGSYKFPGAEGAYLTSNGSAPVTSSSGSYQANEYQIVAGADVATLFEPFSTKHACNIARLTPAQKLTIFLRAVFGISYDDFSGSTKVKFPSSASSGCFLYADSNKEDSGIVLMTIFDYVLGANRQTDSATNKFANKTSVFGNINSGTSSKLDTPVRYFASKITSEGYAGSADIVRLRMLLNDLTGRAQ